MDISPKSPRFHSGWQRLSLGLAAIVLLAGAGGVVWKLQMRSGSPSISNPSQEANADVGVGALGRLEPGWKVYQVAPASAVEGSRGGIAVGRRRRSGLAGGHHRRARYAWAARAALQEARALVQVNQAKLALVKAGVKADDQAAQTAFTEQLRASLGRAEADFKRVVSMSCQSCDLGGRI